MKPVKKPAERKPDLFANCNCPRCGLVQLQAPDARQLAAVVCPGCKAALEPLSFTWHPLAGALQASMGKYPPPEPGGGKTP